MYGTFLSVAILSLAIPAIAQTNCAERLEKPNYPPLARQALIQGEVKARFDVSADGKPVNVVLEGHPLLKEPVEAAIHKGSLASFCQGRLNLVYQFVVSSEISDVAHTSVAFKSPNQFVITTDHVPPDPGVVSPVRRSWFKRLFHL